MEQKDLHLNWSNSLHQHYFKLYWGESTGRCEMNTKRSAAHLFSRLNVLLLHWFLAVADGMICGAICSEFQAEAATCRPAGPFPEIPRGLPAEAMPPCFPCVLGGAAFALLALYQWSTSPLTTHGRSAPFPVPAGSLSVAAAGQPLCVTAPFTKPVNGTR